MEVYLDNSATTKPCEEAIEAVSAAMRGMYYNPSAFYAPAFDAERVYGNARAVVAKSVGASDKEIIFTSGGTESNNLAIFGHLAFCRQPGVVLYTAAEHPAVKNACVEAAALYGHAAVEIPLTREGTVDLDALQTLLSPEVRLLCVMQVCNETGVIMPLEEISVLRDRFAPEAALHVDGVQGYLRVPFSMRHVNVQTYAMSAHKVHGPKGVGALVVRAGHRLRPMLAGGGQQGGMRSGTENTSGVAGFCAAIEHFPEMKESAAQMRAMKAVAVEVLKSEIPSTQINGMPAEAEKSAAHILSIAFPPVRAETLVHALEAEGVLVGTGSACSSKKGKRSSVLSAMKVAPEVIDSTVRISFSPHTGRAEVERAVALIVEQYQKLSKFRRR